MKYWYATTGYKQNLPKIQKKREKEKEKKDGRKKVEHKILTSDSISKLCKFHKQWRFQIEYETSQTTAPTKG